MRSCLRLFVANREAIDYDVSCGAWMHIGCYRQLRVVLARGLLANPLPRGKMEDFAVERKKVERSQVSVWNCGTLSRHFEHMYTMLVFKGWEMLSLWMVQSCSGILHRRGWHHVWECVTCGEESDNRHHFGDFRHPFLFVYTVEVHSDKRFSEGRARWWGFQ